MISLIHLLKETSSLPGNIIGRLHSMEHLQFLLFRHILTGGPDEWIQSNKLFSEISHSEIHLFWWLIDSFERIENLLPISVFFICFCQVLDLESVQGLRWVISLHIDFDLIFKLHFNNILLDSLLKNSVYLKSQQLNYWFYDL